MHIFFSLSMSNKFFLLFKYMDRFHLRIACQYLSVYLILQFAPIFFDKNTNWDEHKLVVIRQSRAALVLIFLCQKITKPNRKWKKSCTKHFCTKKLSVKCWWNWHLRKIASNFANNARTYDSRVVAVVVVAVAVVVVVILKFSNKAVFEICNYSALQ